MSLDEGLLEIVAQDGTMDYDRWPSQLEPLLERLDEIVRNEFPIPKVPPELASSFASQPSSFPSSYPVQDSLQSSNKENAPPPADQPLFSETQEVSEQQSSNQPSQTDADCLPPPLLSLLTSIKSTLRTYFVSNPPHTIQRLAELILRPTRQYRTLPAYLRAVDRVVSVSSSADIFPLPRTDVPGEGELSNGISNGTTSNFIFADDSLGSDESLGGALLTPIPWLTNPHLEVAHADMVVEGAVPLRANAAVTQGELIRQEQEAGLVANSQASHSSVNALVEGEESGERLSPQPDEVPHARGPSVVGVEDLGLQDGKGVEMTISNSTPAQEDNNTEMDASSSLNPSNETPADETNESNGDADGDIVLDDISAKDNSAAPTRAEIEEDVMETNEQNEQKLPNAETSTAE